MGQDYKYRFNAEEVKLEKEQQFRDGILKKENKDIVHLDLKPQQNSIELDLETGDSGELELTLESNSRCVSVDTFSPSPLGRRKKKSVRAKSEIIKFRCSIYIDYKYTFIRNI